MSCCSIYLGIFIQRTKFDLKKAQKILDRDHYGLEKVKERIIEYLGRSEIEKDMKSPILCLYGPPGVEKPLWVIRCRSRR